MRPGVSSQLLNITSQNANATPMSESSDRNDGSRFDGSTLGLVGDQLAQERNETEGSGTWNLPRTSHLIPFGIYSSSCLRF
jgi:hypothetical protein